ERDPAALGDIERARVLEIPRLEIRKVDLDRPGLRVDVQVQVVLARHPRARPHLLAALRARGRARDIARRVHQRAEPQLLARQPLHRDRLAARARAAPAAAQLATDLGQLALGLFVALARGFELQLLLFISIVIGAHRVSSWLEQVFGAPRGAGQSKRVGAWRRDPARQLAQVRDQLIAGAPGLGELLLDLRVVRVGVGAQAREQRGEMLADALDEVVVREELSLDLLDRVALGHERADRVDPADRLGRVEPERALVLALAADAAAARQESLL